MPTAAVGMQGRGRVQRMPTQRGHGTRAGLRYRLRAIVVAVRVRLVPVPGRVDDWLKFEIARLPSELLARTRRVGHQLGRIAWPARARLDGDRLAAGLAAGLDHFANAVAPPDAQVELQPMSRLQSFQGQQMGAGQIVDVDVVANAGAVGRGIILAEDLDLLPLPQGHLQHQRNQMRFRIVVFADVARRRCAAALK